MRMETSEAFSHLHVDPSVMELPAVFLSQVDWVYSSQPGFALVPPAVLGPAWGSALHRCGTPGMLFSIEPDRNVLWVHVMSLGALFSWELRIMKRGCWKSSFLSGRELTALKGSWVNNFLVHLTQGLC